MRIFRITICDNNGADLKELSFCLSTHDTMRGDVL